MKKALIQFTIFLSILILPHNILGISISDIKELNKKDRPECDKINKGMSELVVKKDIVYKFKFTSPFVLSVWVDKTWYEAKYDDKIEYITFFVKYAYCAKYFIEPERVEVVVLDAYTSRQVAIWKKNTVTLY